MSAMTRSSAHGLHRRRLRIGTVPSHPLDSPDVRILEAEIDAAASERPGIVASARRREEAREEGHLSAAARYLPEGLDPALRAAFAAEGGIVRIIGDWSPDAAFVPGAASLTAQECRAYELWLGGFSLLEIARCMDRKRVSSLFGEGHLPVETVTGYLKEARRKLRALFGVKAA